MSEPDSCADIVSGRTESKPEQCDELSPPHSITSSAAASSDCGLVRPSAFNTPQTLEEIVRNNDVQLFDLESDPEEMSNLVLEPEKNQETILRMNGLLNELMAKEVGVNDGRFLPRDIRPK